MPKGRLCNPSTLRDGLWYSHPEGFERMTLPSTMTMLKATELMKAQDPEWRLPLKLAIKPPKDVKPDFPFSSHDNKHAMQNTVEYFDGGLGRKKVGKEKGQNQSQNFTQWCHGVPPKASSYFDGFTNYQTSYASQEDTERPFCRRYPKHHTARFNQAETLPENDFQCQADATGQDQASPNNEAVSHAPSPKSTKSTSLESL